MPKVVKQIAAICIRSIFVLNVISTYKNKGFFSSKLYAPRQFSSCVYNTKTYHLRSSTENQRGSNLKMLHLKELMELWSAVAQGAPCPCLPCLIAVFSDSARPSYALLFPLFHSFTGVSVFFIYIKIILGTNQRRLYTTL